MTSYRPPALRGSKQLAQQRKVIGVPLTPATVNVALMGASLLLGIAAWHYKDTPIGSVLLGAAGSVAGVSTVFFINEALFGAAAPA